MSPPRVSSSTAATTTACSRKRSLELATRKHGPSRRLCARRDGSCGIGIGFELTPEGSDVPGAFVGGTDTDDRQDGSVRTGHGAHGRHLSGERERHGDRPDRRRRDRHRPVGNHGRPGRLEPLPLRLRQPLEPQHRGRRRSGSLGRRRHRRQAANRRRDDAAFGTRAGLPGQRDGDRHRRAGEGGSAAPRSLTPSTPSATSLRSASSRVSSRPGRSGPRTSAISQTSRAASSRSRPTRTRSTSPWSRSTPRPASSSFAAMSSSTTAAPSSTRPSSTARSAAGW